MLDGYWFYNLIHNIPHIPLNPQENFFLKLRYIFVGVFKVNKHLIITPL
jgi:hypothetical protein